MYNTIGLTLDCQLYSKPNLMNQLHVASSYKLYDM